MVLSSLPFQLNINFTLKKELCIVMRQFEGMDSERHGVKLKLSIRLIISANVADFEGND